LAAVPGAARRFALTRPITEIRLPGTVQAVLAARIDRLPDEERAVLMTAAVIGKRFTAGLLHRVVEALGAPHGGALALAAILGDLARQELVSPSDDGADDVYAFRHPLTQEVAYRAQLADPRARTHAAVARVLETTHAQQLDEHAAVLAHHWEAAGEVLEAARWHHRAADWIGARDRRESTRHWKTVCALLEPLPVTADSAQLGILARQRRLYNAVYLGQPEDEQHALFTQGRSLALAHGGHQFLEGHRHPLDLPAHAVRELLHHLHVAAGGLAVLVHEGEGLVVEVTGHAQRRVAAGRRGAGGEQGEREGGEKLHGASMCG